MMHNRKRTHSSADPSLAESKKSARKKVLLRTAQTILALLVVLAMAFPLYWMFITSLKTDLEMYEVVPTIWPASGLHWENYLTALTRVPLLKYTLNTVVMTFWQLFLQLTTGILAAYGFARGRFKFRNTLFVLVLGALMIPQQVTFVPIYVMIANLDWIDTMAGLVFPGAVSAYMIFMLRQNFMSVDQSYLDAGRVDGLGIIGTLRHVLVPMCRSSIVTVALVTIMDGWNNYFWPKIISKTDATRVLSVGLVYLKSSWGENEYVAHYNVVMAAVLLSLIPIVVLFFTNQKYMLSGYSKAAMK